MSLDRTNEKVVIDECKPSIQWPAAKPKICHICEYNPDDMQGIVSYLAAVLNAIEPCVTPLSSDQIYNAQSSPYLYSYSGEIIFGYDFELKGYISELSFDEYRELILGLPKELPGMKSTAKAYLSELQWFSLIEDSSRSEQKEYALSERPYRSNNTKCLPAICETERYSTVISKLLANNQGIGFLHDHRHVASYEFLAALIPVFKKQGVSKFYVEFTQKVNDLFDKFNQSGDTQALEQGLKLRNVDFCFPECKNHFFDLIKSLREAGVKMEAIDMDNGNLLDMKLRKEIADDVIVRNIESANHEMSFDKGARYIILLGGMHHRVCMKENLNIPAYGILRDTEVSGVKYLFKNMMSSNDASFTSAITDREVSQDVSGYDVMTVLPVKDFKLEQQAVCAKGASVVSLWKPKSSAEIKQESSVKVVDIMKVEK